jgi:lysophospholipase L1-like esterase
MSGATSFPPDAILRINQQLVDLLTAMTAATPTTEPVAPGIVWRNTGVVTVSVGIPPGITSQPSNATVNAGDPVTFSVTATNATSYQWRRDGVNISGATSTSYTIAETFDGDSAAVFSVVIVGPGGTTNSANATLTVTPFDPATITPSVWMSAGTSYLFTNTGGSTPVASTSDPISSYTNRATSALVVNTNTGTNRPVYDLAEMNLKPSIRFSLASAQGLSGPTSKAFNLRDFTIAYSGMPRYSDTGGAAGLSGRWQLGAGSNLNFYSSGDTNGYGIFNSSTGSINIGQPRLYVPGPMIVRGSASALKFRQFRYEVSRAALPATSGTVLNIGNLATSYYYEGYYRQFLMFDRALTDAETDDLEAWMTYDAGAKVASLTKPIVVFDGDSLSVGTSGTTNVFYSVSRQCAEGLDVTSVCCGIAGQTAAQIASRYATRSGLFLVPEYAKKIVVLWAGTNDLALAQSAATVFASFESAATAARTAGADYIIAVTCLPRGDATFESSRQTLNASILADANNKWDYVADVGANTTIGDYADRLNLTYYAADATHLTDAGAAIAAGIIKTQIQAAMAAS